MKLDGLKAQISLNAKSLGFTLDTNLALKEVIAIKIQTAWYLLYLLKKVKPFLP